PARCAVRDLDPGPVSACRCHRARAAGAAARRGADARDRWRRLPARRARSAAATVAGAGERYGMKRFLAPAFVLLLAGAAAALVFVGGGFVPIAADRGHWPITRAALEFAMQRSVRMQSHGIAPPEAPLLDEPAMLRKGAGHYANGCMTCHGAPGVERPLVPRAMLPEPPPLVRQLAPHPWSREELFWIVKHGIKYTAMPHWVAHNRDDEVWAMVACLERLPDLSPEDYRRLAYGGRDVAPGACEGCHGSGGPGADAFPRLAGLDAEYLRESLAAFASGRRRSGVMQPI